MDLLYPAATSMASSSTSETTTTAESLPWYSCLKQPHMWVHQRNRKTLILAGCALAFLFSALQVSECNFVRTGSQTERGLFRRASYDTDGTRLGCVAYEEKDSMLRTARAFGTITCMLTLTSLLAVAASLCFRPRITPLLWKASLGFNIWAVLSQMLSFLVMDSEFCRLNDCKLTGVGILAIFTTLLLAGVASLQFIEPTPNQPWLIIWYDNFFESEDETDVSPGATVPLGGQDVQDVPASSSGEKPSDRKARFAPEITFMGEVDATEDVPEISFSDSDSLKSGYGFTLAKLQERSKRLRYRLLYSGVICLVWSISLIVNQRCTLMLVGLKDTDRDLHSGFGLYSRAIYNQNDLLGCVAFSSDLQDSGSLDGPYQAGRVFGALTSLLLTTCFLLTTTQLFSQMLSEEVWWVIRGLLSASCLTQILVFVAFSSKVCNGNEQTQCILGGAGVAALLNIMLLFGLTAITFVLKAPVRLAFLRYTAANKSRLRTTSSLERKLSNLPDGSVEDVTCQSDQSASQQHESNVQRFLKECESITPTYQRAPDDAQHISVRVEYSADNTERKTIKEITHPDGSKTITTTIEELDSDDEYTEYEESVSETNSVYSTTSAPSPRSNNLESLLSGNQDDEYEEEEIIDDETTEEEIYEEYTIAEETIEEEIIEDETLEEEEYEEEEVEDSYSRDNQDEREEKIAPASRRQSPLRSRPDEKKDAVTMPSWIRHARAYATSKAGESSSEKGRQRLPAPNRVTVAAAPTIEPSLQDGGANGSHKEEIRVSSVLDKVRQFEQGGRRESTPDPPPSDENPGSYMSEIDRYIAENS